MCKKGACMKIMAVFPITVKIYVGYTEGGEEKIYDRRDKEKSKEMLASFSPSKRYSFVSPTRNS